MNTANPNRSVTSSFGTDFGMTEAGIGAIEAGIGAAGALAGGLMNVASTSAAQSEARELANLSRQDTLRSEKQWNERRSRAQTQAEIHQGLVEKADRDQVRFERFQQALQKRTDKNARSQQALAGIQRMAQTSDQFKNMLVERFGRRKG